MSFETVDITLDNGLYRVTKRNQMTVADVERILKSFPYSGERRAKDEDVENAKLPPMIEIFYELIGVIGSIPTEKVFLETYLLTYFDKIEGGRFYCLKKQYQKDNNKVCFKKEGLEGRILRAYPSLVRDYHFYLLCRESGKFERVFYSTKKDTEEGIDLTIQYKGQVYVVSLFVNTSRSQGFKKRKYKRHNYRNLKEICIALDLDKAKRVGNFALYDESHINDILRQIDDYNIKNYFRKGA